MHSDMQGIIEEQRISRRKTRSARSAGHGIEGPPSWVGAERWVAEGSGAPVMTEATLADVDTTVRLRADERRSGPATPFLPVSTTHQRPASRRADRLWLRRFVRPKSAMTRLVTGTGRSMTTAMPACYLAVLIAVPVALLALSVVLNTALTSRGLLASRLLSALPSTALPDLLLDTRAERERFSGEPLSIDPRQYEKIRRTTYRVQPGDTISGIAQRFGLKAGTILSMNPIDDVRRLLPGTTLSIPDRDGLFHGVQPGESLAGIAETYGVSVNALLDANDVRSPVLQVGDVLFVPGATMPEEDYLLAIGELFAWPVRRFTFTSGFGMRIHPITGVWHLHNGIDLANRIGTPILAAGAGRVVHVENQVSNYGKMVIIDHGNGYRTLYGHMDSFLVSEGEYVSAGQQIGTMGTTGRSTGPHLHFSVFRGSQPIDPLSQLGGR